MLQFKPKFITVDDFNNYWGVNLEDMLKDGNGNDSNRANMFLVRAEDRVTTFIDANTFRNIPWNKLTSFQLEHFQKALLTQAMYMFKTGDIGLDSGYDVERGIIVSQEDLKSITICSAALDFLKTAGLYNHKMTARRRYSPFLGIYGPESGYNDHNN